MTSEKKRGETVWPVVWGALLLAPAVLILTAQVAGPGTVVHGAVHSAFRTVCHQAPDRSLVLFGNTMVVCARCTGFYAGLAGVGVLAAIALMIGLRWRISKAAFLIAVPLVIDGSANLIGIWQSGELLRAITGLVAAAPVAVALMGRKNEAF